MIDLLDNKDIDEYIQKSVKDPLLEMEYIFGSRPKEMPTAGIILPSFFLDIKLPIILSYRPPPQREELIGPDLAKASKTVPV